MKNSFKRSLTSFQGRSMTENPAMSLLVICRDSSSTSIQAAREFELDPSDVMYEFSAREKMVLFLYSRTAAAATCSPRVRLNTTYLSGASSGKSVSPLLLGTSVDRPDRSMPPDQKRTALAKGGMRTARRRGQGVSGHALHVFPHSMEAYPLVQEEDFNMQEKISVRAV